MKGSCPQSGGRHQFPPSFDYDARTVTAVCMGCNQRVSVTVIRTRSGVPIGIQYRDHDRPSEQQ